MKGTLRQRLTISVIAVTAVMLALLVLGFNLALRSSLSDDADRLLQARAQAALESVDVEGDELDVSENSDDGAPDALVWVFSGDRAIEHPQAGGSLDAVAADLAKSGERQIDDESTDTRLYALPVTDDGSKVGTVVSGISMEPYERTANRSAIGSVILALIMIVLIGLTTRMVVNRALRPVAKMTAEAADWSEHDLDRRFNEGVPNDELSRLAATFDTMLDRMAFMVRHERNFSAELSHELRTPLAAIAAEAEIALRREREPGEYRDSLRRISERSAELTRILETLLDVARSEGGASAGESVLAGPEIERALTATASLAETYGVRVAPFVPDTSLAVRVGPDTFGRIVAPVIENGLTYAESELAVETRSEDRLVRITVTDDGPGFAAGEADDVFEPGRRGSAKRNTASPPGTGLGLPLARRLARANGGDVVLDEGEGRRPGRVHILLPGAVERP
ncbi:MAG TPA: histidine kinase dimerization/phospho-acceptor domain-containing protein [Solirubrobacterales bacterium]|nr:histidine kinase dimerization/phospho-acceptor domain-containing protein [Solirubrobacterales bacterium]